jgi:hypothetical protein
MARSCQSRLEALGPLWQGDSDIDRLSDRNIIAEFDLVESLVNSAHLTRAEMIEEVERAPRRARLEAEKRSRLRPIDRLAVLSWNFAEQVGHLLFYLHFEKYAPGVTSLEEQALFMRLEDELRGRSPAGSLGVTLKRRGQRK